MADSKITALDNLTAADPVNDMFPIVDVSDTTMAASGTTKRISANNILSSSPTASGALTVTGLVTAGSATITGAATVGTTLGVTGVSTLTGAVGVGAAPANGIKLASYVTTAGAPATSGTTQSAGSLRIAATSTAGVMDMGTNGSYSWIQPCNASNLATNYDLYLNPNGGNVNIGNGNVVMATSGKGIDFAATASGSGTMTSELLNDYEEGTFTPTVTSEFGTIGTTIVTNANYTKIGRLVSVNFDISITTAGTGSGSLLVSVPFNIGEEACGAGRETSNTGNMCQVFRQSATAVAVRFYNNSTPIANTNRVLCSYTYNV